MPRPLREPRFAVRFHHLETAVEVEIDPARHVLHVVRRHAPTLAESSVDLRCLSWFEMLDHHEQHQNPWNPWNLWNLWNLVIAMVACRSRRLRARCWPA